MVLSFLEKVLTLVRILLCENMRQMKLIGMLIVVLFGCCALGACNADEYDEPNDIKKLVGSWECAKEQLVISFYSNNRGYFTYVDGGKLEIESFTYKYLSEKNLISANFIIHGNYHDFSYQRNIPMNFSGSKLKLCNLKAGKRAYGWLKFNKKDELW